MLDVITMGETMLRLSPPNYERLEFTTKLDLKIGGSESNVAVALSRLGMKVGWISKLTDNSLGRRVENELRRWNVDVNGIIWTPDYRVGTYYAEFGSDPRPTNIIYDREFSAFSNIKLEEIDWTYLNSCKLFHTSGITVVLSQNCEVAVKKCLEFIKEKGKLTSFDINFRAKLTTPKKALKQLIEILPQVDILFSSEKDIDLIFKEKADLKEKCTKLLEKFSLKIIILTRGPNPPYILEENGKEHFGKGNTPNLVDRIGAGDAFDAGFLYGYLLGDIEKAIKYGEAMSALKFSIPGDFAILTKQEVEEFIQRENKGINR
ncbi:MAG TPA: sugar kinase [Candidatus Deferrimicrobium sp.]|nr:sugar kinase [Candidatus Deferrimicrobium sp.]